MQLAGSVGACFFIRWTSLPESPISFFAHMHIGAAAAAAAGARRRRHKKSTQIARSATQRELLWRAKCAQFFDAYDKDADGVVDVETFCTMVENLCGVFKRDAHEAAPMILRRIGDDKLTRARAARALALASDYVQAVRRVEDAIETSELGVCEAWDRDITMRVMTSIKGVVQVDDADVDAVFVRAGDRCGVGEISSIPPDVAREAIAEWYVVYATSPPRPRGLSFWCCRPARVACS